jgi:hypothetical protein
LDVADPASVQRADIAKSHRLGREGNGPAAGFRELVERLSEFFDVGNSTAELNSDLPGFAGSAGIGHGATSLGFVRLASLSLSQWMNSPTIRPAQ